MPPNPWVLRIAVGIVVVCAVIRIGWEIHQVYPRYPNFLNVMLWPWVDKTSLAALRLINFFAVAVVGAKLVTPYSGLLNRGWAKRVILRDHAKQRQEVRRTGQSPSAAPLNAVDFLLAVDDFSRVGSLRFKDEQGRFCRAAESGRGGCVRNAPSSTTTAISRSASFQA